MWISGYPRIPHLCNSYRYTFLMETFDHFIGNTCVGCGRFFVPDPRVGKRQKSCGAAQCRKKRKQLQEKRWREKNSGYFHGRYTYVKAWRQAHPGYQKAWRDRRRSEIQTQIASKTPVKSIRIHVRTPLRFDEIQTQILRVTYAGQAFWVDGAGMQAA